MDQPTTRSTRKTRAQTMDSKMLSKPAQQGQQQQRTERAATMAAACTYVSATGRKCSKPRAPGAKFCTKFHLCPTPECGRSKASKSKICDNCDAGGNGDSGDGGGGGGGPQRGKQASVYLGFEGNGGGGRSDTGLTNHLMFESAFRRSFFFLGGGEGRKKSKIDLFMRKLEREDRDREM